MVATTVAPNCQRAPGEPERAKVCVCERRTLISDGRCMSCGKPLREDVERVWRVLGVG